MGFPLEIYLRIFRCDVKKVRSVVIVNKMIIVVFLFLSFVFKTKRRLFFRPKRRGDIS